MKDKNERYFKVGKVNIDLDNFFKTDWDQVKVNALIDLLYFPLRILNSLEGVEIDKESNQKIYQIFEREINHKSYYELSQSWKALFGEGSFLPYHLDGCILDGDEESFDIPVFEHILKNNDIKSIIDVGCGSGHVTNYFKEKGKICTGVDGSPRAIKYARNKFKNIEFIEHDFAKGKNNIVISHDIAISIEFLEHVEEKYQENYMNIFEKSKKCYVTFAPEGQPGYHHVNCRNQEYWINVFDKYNFDFCEEETDLVRSIASGYYFKNNGLVFKKRE